MENFWVPDNRKGFFCKSNSVISENTEIIAIRSSQGWIFYDGTCPFCIGLANRFKKIFNARGYHFIPLQTPWVRQLFRLPDRELLQEMRIMTSDRKIIGGAKAVIHLSQLVWWGWPLYGFAQIPGTIHMLSSLYRMIARNRHCFGGTCTRPKPSTWKSWLPLVVLPSFMMFFGTSLSPWAFMLGICLAIYAGFKWLTWWRVSRTSHDRARLRSIGYLIAWPGMDAQKFLNQNICSTKPKAIEWVHALLKTVLGTVTVWGVVRTVPHHFPLLAGWVGGLGLLIFLHFGLFHLISLLWRQAGIMAYPIMQTPAMAKSLSDFWGRRWNLGFRNLSYDLVFYPLHKRFGSQVAMFLTFLVSGIIHELAISLPSGAGYGLPTIYFLIQALGISIEHSKMGKRLRLHRGFRGWFFALIFIVGPAYWLFHPPFITQVMIPLMDAIGAWP